jgi:hypothetical protein
MATATKQSAAARDGDRPRATPVPAPAASTGSHHGEGRLQGLIAKRLAAATQAALDGPNQTLMNAQKMRISTRDVPCGRSHGESGAGR